MSKWKCGICNSEFDNFQAQGFGGTIYCPLCYFKELYRRTKLEIDRLNKEYERIYNENCKLRENHNINDITLLDENERLNNIIDTMLEFSFFKEECPLNFGFGDEKEEKAQDVFYEDDYCEENCNDIYKKCWLKYFEKLQELKENNK